MASREIIMPKLGETMEEGYLVKWFRAEGEKVEKGEPLFEVMSDKTNFEVEAPASGYLRAILREAGEEPIPVITTLAWLTDKPDEEIPASGKAPTPAAKVDGGAEKGEGGHRETPSRPSGPVDSPGAPAAAGHVPASPLARRMAREKGVDIARVRGSGPGGRVVEKDVLAAAASTASPAAPAPGPAPGGGTRLSPMRRIIAERLARSKREIPHYYLRKVFDASGMTRKREILREQVTTVTYTDILLKVVADGLREFPDLNATFDGQVLARLSEVNIGLAVGRPEGLVVPVVKSVQSMDFLSLITERNRLVSLAREDRLERADLEGGSFTVSNLGVYRIDCFFPIIYQPQVAIMGVGSIRDGILVSGRDITVRPLVELTLACDHRVVDGDYSARFLARLQEIIDGLAP